MKPGLSAPGPGELALLFLAVPFFGALSVLILRVTIVALRNGEIRFRGADYSKDETPFWYWFLMLQMMVYSAFSGLSSLVFLGVLFIRARLALLG